MVIDPNTFRTSLFTVEGYYFTGAIKYDLILDAQYEKANNKIKLVLYLKTSDNKLTFLGQYNSYQGSMNLSGIDFSASHNVGFTLDKDGNVTVGFDNKVYRMVLSMTSSAPSGFQMKSNQFKPTKAIFAGSELLNSSGQSNIRNVMVFDHAISEDELKTYAKPVRIYRQGPVIAMSDMASPANQYRNVVFDGVVVETTVTEVRSDGSQVRKSHEFRVQDIDKNQYIRSEILTQNGSSLPIPGWSNSVLWNQDVLDISRDLYIDPNAVVWSGEANRREVHVKMFLTQDLVNRQTIIRVFEGEWNNLTRTWKYERLISKDVVTGVFDASDLGLQNANSVITPPDDANVKTFEYGYGISPTGISRTDESGQKTIIQRTIDLSGRLIPENSRIIVSGLNEYFQVTNSTRYVVQGICGANDSACVAGATVSWTYKTPEAVFEGGLPEAHSVKIELGVDSYGYTVTQTRDLLGDGAPTYTLEKETEEWILKMMDLTTAELNQFYQSPTTFRYRSLRDRTAGSARSGR